MEVFSDGRAFQVLISNTERSATGHCPECGARLLLVDLVGEEVVATR
jgi:hypothetical protein